MPTLTYKDLLSSKELESKKLEIKQALIREYNEEFQNSLENILDSIQNQENSFVYILFTPASILFISAALISLSAYCFYLTGVSTVILAVDAIQASQLSSSFFDTFFLGIFGSIIGGSLSFIGIGAIFSAFINLYHLYEFVNRAINGLRLHPGYFHTLPNYFNSWLEFFEPLILLNYALACTFERGFKIFASLTVNIFYRPCNLYQNLFINDDLVEQIVSSYAFLKNDKENCNSEVSNEISNKLAKKLPNSQAPADLLSYLETAPSMLLFNKNKNFLTEITGLAKEYKNNNSKPKANFLHA